MVATMMVKYYPFHVIVASPEKDFFHFLPGLQNPPPCLPVRLQFLLRGLWQEPNAAGIPPIAHLLVLCWLPYFTLAAGVATWGISVFLCCACCGV